jgi:hypothetical protein
VIAQGDIDENALPILLDIRRKSRSVLTAQSSTLRSHRWIQKWHSRK